MSNDHVAEPFRSLLAPMEPKPASDTPRKIELFAAPAYVGGRWVVREKDYRQLERELADLQHDMARTLANHSADLSSAPAVDRDAVLEELTPLTFELGSARAGLYSNDTAVVPWEAVKRALKDKP